MLVNILRKKYNFFIYLFVGVVFFYGTLNLSTFGIYYPEYGNILNRVQKYLSLFLIFIAIDRIITSGYDKRKIAFFILFMFFLAATRTKTWVIFELFFVPFLLNDTLDIKKVYKIILVSILLSVFVISFLYVTNAILTLDYVKYGSNKIYTFGFRHPNFLGFSILLLTTVYLLLRDVIRLFDVLVVLIAFIVCHCVTESRTSSALLLLLLISAVICTRKNSISLNMRKKVFYFTCAVYIVLILLFYFFAITESGRSFLQNKYLGSLDARLYMGKYGLEHYGFSILGQDVDFVGNYEETKEKVYWVIDSSCFYLPIAMGILPALMIFFCHIFSFKNAIFRCDLKVYLIQIIFVLFELFEIVSITSALSMVIYFAPFANIFKNKS